MTFLRLFFLCANIISLPGHRNKRKSVLEKTQNVLPLYSNYNIIKEKEKKMRMYRPIHLWVQTLSLTNIDNDLV